MAPAHAGAFVYHLTNVQEGCYLSDIAQGVRGRENIMNARKAKVIAGWVLSLALVATLVGMVVSLEQYGVI